MKKTLAGICAFLCVVSMGATSVSAANEGAELAEFAGQTMPVYHTIYDENGEVEAMNEYSVEVPADATPAEQTALAQAVVTENEGLALAASDLLYSKYGNTGLTTLSMRIANAKCANRYNSVSLYMIDCSNRVYTDSVNLRLEVTEGYLEAVKPINGRDGTYIHTFNYYFFQGMNFEIWAQTRSGTLNIGSIEVYGN